jgi:DNA-binding transcriptional LysR family regulator
LRATLRFRFPTTGKLHAWPLSEPAPLPPAVLICNNMEALRAAAIGGMGIGCMPGFLARDAFADAHLQRLLDGYLGHSGQFFVL